MKHILLFVGLLLPTQSMFAGACLPGTLQDYLFLGSGCTVGGVQFADFFFGALPNFATEIDPSLIQVTPGGPLFAPTLLLTFNTTANAGQVLESSFHFSATADAMFSAGISLGSPQVSGDGAITGILDVCAGGFFLGVEPIGCSGSPGTGIAFATELDSQLSSQLDFPATSFFDVFVDVSIDGGLAGFASLDTASVSVTTPEPSVPLLLAVSLAGIGTLKLRRLRRQ